MIANQQMKLTQWKRGMTSSNNNKMRHYQETQGKAKYRAQTTKAQARRKTLLLILVTIFVNVLFQTIKAVPLILCVFLQ